MLIFQQDHKENPIKLNTQNCFLERFTKVVQKKLDTLLSTRVFPLGKWSTPFLESDFPMKVELETVYRYTSKVPPLY